MNNTNDEQAPYGEKREPLLSDEAQYDLCGEAGEPVDQPEYCGGPGLYSARRVRDFYENLIDKGELRVVKKVELWHPSVPEEEWKKWLAGSDADFSMLVTKCCSRNPWCPPWGRGIETWDDNKRELRLPRLSYVCPGCGGEIQK